MDDEDITMGSQPTATVNGLKARSPRAGANSAVAIMDEQGDLSSGSSAARSSTRSTGRNKVSADESVTEEVIGEPWVPSSGESVESEEVSAHEEVGNTVGAGSGEEFSEATLEQLEAMTETGEEAALSDLRDIEGFRSNDGSTESIASLQQPLREAGTAISTGQEAEPEFFPILASLIPTLISTIGPPLAKAVVGRLSPVAKKVITSIPPRPSPTGAAPRPLGGLLPAGLGNILSQLAPLLAKLLKVPGSESDAEVDEAYAQEAAAALEVIIGIDDRVRITQTSQVPWRRICALRITFPSGATYRGTGFLIGPRTVATAGHCVYLHNQGGWARKVEVIPGCNGSTRPFGRAESTSFRSVKGWVIGKKPESDYGCIVLPAGAFGGHNLGCFGFANFNAQKLLAQSAVLAGHPGDKPFAEMWGMARKFKTVTAKTLIYDIDTVGGQSGAPVYIKRNGQRYVVGIHNYGASTGNSATRITQSVYSRLSAWSKL